MSASSVFTTGSGLQDVNRANVLDLGQVYKSNVNLTLVDPGALALGGELASLGIATASSAVDGLTDVMGEILPYAALENDRNRAFAGQAVTIISDESERNRAFAGQAVSTVSTILANAAGKVMDFARGESEYNRAFAGQASQMAVDAAQRSSAETIQFVAGEGDKNRAFAGQAVAEVSRVSESALGAIAGGYDTFVGGFEDAMERAFSFAGGAVSASNQHIAGLVGAVTKNSIESIETLSDASRSDAAKSLDKVMLMGAVMVGLIMWRKGF